MISMRNCKQCGAVFDAVVGEDSNIYCEKCRELIDVREADDDYTAIVASHENNSVDLSAEDDICDIDDDILSAALSVAIPVTNNNHCGHRPNILNDFGKSLK